MPQNIKKAILLIFFVVLNTYSFADVPDNKEKARQHYLKGNIYYREGRYKEAEEQFNLALEAAKPKKEAPKQAPKVKEEPRKVVPLPEKVYQGLEYTLGEDDTLNITVWQNPDLTQEVIVRPDGRISFPLVGDIWAVGKTITQLDEELTGKLKEYIRYPEVSISIKKLGGKKIMVLGEVFSPGVYTVTGKKRVVEAIAMAGGFNSNAVVNSVIVIQGGLLKPKGIRLNLNRALLKGDFRHNILLNPDDIIFVPKKFVANINYLVNSIVGPIAQGTFNTEQLYHKRW